MTDHEHAYRLLVTRLRNGDYGIERFLTTVPKYSWRCPCGEIQRADLPTAAARGWVEVLDLSQP